MMNGLPYIYMGVSVLAFAYFFLLWVYCGHVPAFGGFWAGAGVFFEILCLTGFLITGDQLTDSRNGWLLNHLDLLKNIYTGFSFCLLLVFLGMVCWICYLLSQGNKKGSQGAEYVIILGSKVNGTVPSRALMSRIRKAYEYLSENPGGKGVLTGGRGKGEDISEALCMKRELMAQGIREERLILEERSSSTMENLLFAAEIISRRQGEISESYGKEKESQKKITEEKESHKKVIEEKVIIITNDFHTLRGKAMARAAGFENVESIGAPSSKIMKLNYYARETFSWVKFCLHEIRRKLFSENGSKR